MVDGGFVDGLWKLALPRNGYARHDGASWLFGARRKIRFTLNGGSCGSIAWVIVTGPFEPLESTEKVAPLDRATDLVTIDDGRIKHTSRSPPKWVTQLIP
jgi:hypothetical protein